MRPLPLALLIASFLSSGWAGPSNDNFTDRRRLFGNEINISGTTRGATTEPSEPFSYAGSVWFSWTPSSSGTFEFGHLPENAVNMEVFRGKTFESLTWLPVASPRSVLRLEVGEPYQIRITSSYLGEADFTLKIWRVARPRNDDFVHAIPFAGTNTVMHGTVRNATPDHGSIYAVGTGNVWYRWTALEDGLFFAQATSQTPGLSVEVYGGGPTPDLLLPEGLSVNGLRRGSSFHARAGSNFWISVEGYTQGSSTFMLGVTAEAPPSNDLFENRIVLSGAEVSIEGTSLGARRDPFEPYTVFFPQEYIWYSWTAPTSGLYRIAARLIVPPATNGPGIPRPPFSYPWLTVSTGNAATSLVEVVRSDVDPGALLRAERDITYSIAVPGRMDSFNFGITPVTAEPNDDYAHAILLADGVFAAGGSTINATPEPGHPYSDRQVWYRWRAPSNGVYAIATVIGLSQSISIYRGDDFNTAAYIQGGSRPVLRANAGEEFRFGVGPHYLGSGAAFILRIDAVTPPPNDDFANREQLAGTNATFQARLRDATFESNEDSRVDNVWYSWTAPADGLYVIRFLTNSGMVRVFTGSHLAGLDEIASHQQAAFFDATAGQVFQISVEEQYDHITELTLELARVPAPPNDDFANRIVLSGSSVSATGTLAGATLEPNDPTPEYNARSVWWSWTAPNSGRASIDYNSSSHRRTTVYTGDSLDALQLVTVGWGINFPVEAGVTYQIAVAGEENDLFPFHITMLESPSNDSFAQRRRLVRRTHGTTTGATREMAEPYYANNPLGASVWWRWRAPRNGVYDLTIRGAYAMAVVYTGNQLEELEPLDGTYTPRTDIRLRARAGTTYVIEVSEPNGLSGDYDLEIRRRPSPPNDDFARRIALSGTNLTVFGRNAFASLEPNEPSINNWQRTGRTVWWKWIAPAAGTAFIQFGEGLRKGVAVYEGFNLSELQLLAASDGNAYFDVRAGAEYQIAVDSLLYDIAPEPWQFRLLLVSPPINDSFASRTTLTGAVVQANGTIVGATVEEGEPIANFGHSAWWSWTAPEGGRYTFRASSTNDWLTMSFWSGQSIGTLELISYANSYYRTSELNLALRAGEEISIRMDNPIASPDDSFTLNIYKVVPPANDHFADRAGLVNGRGTNSNEGATAEPGEPGVLNDPRLTSLWWRFTAVSSGWHTVTSPFYVAGGVQFFTGNTLETLAVVNPSYQYSEPRWPLTAGTEYALQVHDPENRLGVVQIEVLYRQPPPNDSFANAVNLTGDHAIASGSNSWATSEPDEPQGSWAVVNSVWWRWTPASTGHYLLALDQSRYPEVFTGTSVSNLISVGGGAYSSYEGYLFRPQGGVEHFIRVVSGGNGEGPIVLQLDRVQPPTNDDFTNRTLLVGSHISLAASNHYATPERGDPLTASFGGQSVWWRWVAPVGGTASLNFTGGLLAGVYRGDALTNLIPASIIGSTSPQRFAVEAGVEYSIGFTTWFYAAGEFTFTLDGPDPTVPAILSLPSPMRSGAERAWVIETSTNLIHWEPFRTNRPGEANVPIAPQRDEPQRYFRVR